VPVIPCSCIFLPVTFGMLGNFRTESILFDVAEVSLPFNAIFGRPALYQFMAVTHYGYLVLKMPTPNGVQKFVDTAIPASLHRRSSRLFAAQHEATAGPGSRDQEPSSSCQRGSSSAPHMQPSGSEDIPVKVIQIRANVAQRTHITGDLDSK
jgi:hypothetical protein